MVIPNADGLRELILAEYHDSITSGHRGVSRTREVISRSYWWPDLDADVAEYVGRCPECQRNKPSNHKPYGLLQPLPIPLKNWESVSLDLITQLPKTAKGHDAVIVFVDRLSKMVHFAATYTDVTAEEVAWLFLEHVFKHHGMPRSLVSDRGSIFTGHFWQELFKSLRTKVQMSTAYHPQTDGQTERMNRLLEETLRHYVNPMQDDWDKHLALIEFAINNSKQGSTRTTPFMLNSCHQPRVPADVDMDSVEGKVPSADEFASIMRERIDAARRYLKAAQDRQRSAYNRKREDISFDIGENVLLSTTNIKLKSPGAKKLLPKYIGPFKILARVGSVAYKLDLPAGYKLHPVFHVSLLKSYKGDGTYQPPPAFVLDGEEYWSVDSIIDLRERKVGRKTRREFLVKWAGFGPEHNTWEPEESLRRDALVAEEVDAFLTKRTQAQPPRVKPTSRRRRVKSQRRR